MAKKKEIKNKKDLFDKIMIANYVIVDSFSYTIGESIGYLFKTILSIVNREKEDIRVIILNKKGTKMSQKICQTKKRTKISQKTGQRKNTL